MAENVPSMREADSNVSLNLVSFPSLGLIFINGKLTSAGLFSPDSNLLHRMSGASPISTGYGTTPA